MANNIFIFGGEAIGDCKVGLGDSLDARVGEVVEDGVVLGVGFGLGVGKAIPLSQTNFLFTLMQVYFLPR
ncbi:MAG: hypothetical protein EBX07_09260 [Burkholderiaceae bacterium]|nr:hypothetical protein [Burkholderiaceae bacterium]